MNTQPVAVSAALCSAFLATTVLLYGQADVSPQLQADLDRAFDTPGLSRSTVAVDVRSASDGRIVYQRNATLRVIPGSVLKILTVAAAAERLGWTHQFETRLHARGRVRGGILEGDLIVTGTGDPSIGAQDLQGAALFDEWVAALRAAGINRVHGRLIGDDNAFEDEPLGGGWAWDYLSAGYAAPSGALSYNENVAVIRARAGATPGSPAVLEIGPPGHGLTIDARVTTGPAGSPVTLSITRAPSQDRVAVVGQLPAGGAPVVRTVSVENPTRYFVDALRLQLAARGIVVTGGMVDIDDVADGPDMGKDQLIARRVSEPLSSLAGYALKVSQNYYGEMFLKALGRGQGPETGSASRGREAARSIFASWGLALDPLVMRDGSGLSRYNYVSAELLSGVLQHLWNDETMRGPFAAALPVGGRDGTLGARMKNAVLDRQVQAKTGTLDNVRSLAGYLHTGGGDTLAFTMIANHFTAPSTEVDSAMERALERLAGF